jgi:hypothetical protein
MSQHHKVTCAASGRLGPGKDLVNDSEYGDHDSLCGARWHQTLEAQGDRPTRRCTMRWR